MAEYKTEAELKAAAAARYETVQEQKKTKTEPAGLGHVLAIDKSALPAPTEGGPDFAKGEINFDLKNNSGVATLQSLAVLAMRPKSKEDEKAVTDYLAGAKKVAKNPTLDETAKFLRGAVELGKVFEKENAPLIDLFVEGNTLTFGFAGSHTKDRTVRATIEYNDAGVFQDAVLEWNSGTGQPSKFLHQEGVDKAVKLAYTEQMGLDTKRHDGAHLGIAG